MRMKEEGADKDEEGNRYIHKTLSFDLLNPIWGKRSSNARVILHR